jgi:hypothetical protein
MGGRSSVVTSYREVVEQSGGRFLSHDGGLKESLHPVAVVIFSGLISSTLLDTFLTPAMFWLFGRKDVERLMTDRDAGAL